MKKHSSYPLFLCLLSGAAALAGDLCDMWSAVPTPDPASNLRMAILRDLTVVSPNDAWAVGDYLPETGGHLEQFTWVLRWDGVEWRQVPSPSPRSCDGCTNTSLWAVEEVSPNEVWAAGYQVIAPPGGFMGTHMLIERWDGESWSVMDTPILGLGSGDHLLDIEAFAADDVWFVGEGHPQANGATPALALRWNGADFEQVAVPIVNPEAGRDAGNVLNALSALAPDDMWAVGETDVTAQGIYSQIHHWDGQRWTHVPGPTPGYYNALYAVEAIAPDDVWAAGEYWDVDGIFGFLIHWDGSSWTQVETPGIMRDLHAFGPDDIYGVGSGIFHFDGVSWSVIETFPEIEGPALAGMDASGPCEVWAGGRQIVPGTSVLNGLTVRSESNQSALSLSQTELRRGRPATFTAQNANVGERVYFIYSLRGVGVGPCPPQLGGLCVDLRSPVTLFGSAVADAGGIASLTLTLPSQTPLIEVSTQAVAPRGLESVKSNTVTENVLR